MLTAPAPPRARRSVAPTKKTRTAARSKMLVTVHNEPIPELSIHIPGPDYNRGRNRPLTHSCLQEPNPAFAGWPVYLTPPVVTRYKGGFGNIDVPRHGDQGWYRDEVLIWAQFDDQKGAWYHHSDYQTLKAICRPVKERSGKLMSVSAVLERLRPKKRQKHRRPR